MRITGWHRENTRLCAAIGWQECVQCKTKKRLDSFYPAQEGGVRNQCKACDNYRKEGK